MYKRHCLLAAAWVVGLAALLCDHFQPVSAVIIGMHGLFGIAATTLKLRKAHCALGRWSFASDRDHFSLFDQRLC
jgi:hypothetical protein